MKNIYLFLWFFLISFFMTPIQAADSPLKSELVAAKVKIKNGKEVFEPAKDAVPGDVLQYTISYKNIGDIPLADLVVLGPIPKGTDYLKDSQMAQSKATFEVSADQGQHWAPPPIYKQVVRSDGSVEQELIPETEYTGIRWKLASPLIAGKEVDFKYRVKVVEG